MIVKPIAATTLTISDDAVRHAIEETGYQMHPFYLDEELNPGNPHARVRTPDTSVSPIDELHEAAGRQCYESWGRPNPATATNSGYLGNIINQQHYSVMEHGCVTFWCDGWTRNMLLELERHQHHEFLGLSVLSTRYVPMGDKPLVLPPIFDELPVDERDELRKEFLWAGAGCQDAYQFVYERLMNLNIPKKEAREAAREILPGAVATTFYATSNIRGWRNIISKRDYSGAAKEIQLFAREVKRHLKMIAPNSMQDFSLED